MKLTDDGLRERDKTVIAYFRERDIPVCGVIGGGYSTESLPWPSVTRSSSK